MGILMRNGINYSGSQLPSVTTEDSGKILTVNNNGAWAAQEVPTDEQVSEAVDEWLTNHPEATTTVQDNSLTWVKFNDALKDMMFKLGITDSKSGDLVSTSDAAEFPLKDLQTEITATQNLNGYEYPWVGGAGENLLDPNITFPNESQYGLTITCADGYNFSYTGTATSSGNIRSTDVIPADAVILPAGTYISKNGTLSLYKANGGWLRNQYSGVAFTVDEPFYVGGIYWEIIEGRTYNINTFIALAKGSTAPSAWTPYENICPISGRTEVNVTRTGKNILYKKDTEHVLGYTNPQMSFMNGTGTTLLFYGVAGKTYTYNRPSTANRNILAYFGTSEPTVGSSSVSWANVNTTFTVQSSGYYVLYIANTALDDDIQIELGSTATAYEPYNGDTFNTELGRTVYGGTLDLTTGELKITHAYVDLGDLTWTTSLSEQIPNVFGAYINNKKDGARNFVTTSYRTVKRTEVSLANGEATGRTKSIGEPKTYILVKDERATTAEEFKTLVTGQKMVYELATPQTISLTPTEVQMLENNNTIWSDSGDVAVSYLVDAKTYIDNH